MPMTFTATPDNVDDLIKAEQQRGFSMYGRYASMHEAYAVILEELQEFWESVRANNPDPVELLHVAATARRALLELSETQQNKNDRRKECLSMSEVRKLGEPDPNRPRIFEPGLG